MTNGRGAWARGQRIGARPEATATKHPAVARPVSGQVATTRQHLSTCPERVVQPLAYPLKPRAHPSPQAYQRGRGYRSTRHPQQATVHQVSKTELPLRPRRGAASPPPIVARPCPWLQRFSIEA